MKRRKLRIAWSVAWGIAASLLLAFCVESYWFFSGAMGKIDSHFFVIETDRGKATLNVLNNFRATLHFSWHYRPVSANDTSLKKLPGTTRGTLGVHWWTYGNGFGGQASLLYLVVFATLLCFLPWLRLSKNFSLRTLLIATTLVAIGLGLIVWLR